MQLLLSPYQLGAITLANRVVFLPFYTAYAESDGLVNQQILDHYSRMAASGAGLTIVEASAIGLGCGPNNAIRAYGEDALPGLTHLASCIRENGSKAILQLVHTGRYSCPSSACGPSPVDAFGVTPRELTAADIAQVTSMFVAAARLAQQAGFDGVELHGAQGYLLASFISSRTNKRLDTYGGSLENRMRFPLEVASAVREAVGNFPIGYRFFSREYLPGGLGLEESTIFAQKLAETLSPAYLSVAAGTYECFASQTDKTARPEEGFMIAEATAVKKAVPQVPIIAAGHLQTPRRGEELLQQHGADLIGLARVLFTDPEWIRKAANRQEESIRACVQCNNCVMQISKGKQAFCARWSKKEKATFLKNAEHRE